MKTKLTQRTLFFGYDCVFTDIDMVFFKDPFKAIDWQADVAVTNDCEDGYHPKVRRSSIGYAKVLLQADLLQSRAMQRKDVHWSKEDDQTSLI